MLNSINGIKKCLLIATGGTIKLDELEQVFNSSASDSEKTNFLMQYLLGQRDWLLDFAKTLLIAVLVYVIGRKIVKKLLKFTDKTMERREVEISVRKFVMSLATWGYNIVLIFIVAGILGVGASSIVAMVGSAGLAVGLALQGSLSNLAGGVLILLLKPFQVGDYIVASGSEGTVQNIDIFYTRILTTDNRVVVIPNGAISDTNVTNVSKMEDRFLIIDFMVPYKTSTKQVREMIMEIMNEDSRVIQDKDKCVVVDKLNPNMVKMQAKCWTKTSDYWGLRYYLVEEIKERLQSDENNV